MKDPLNIITIASAPSGQSLGKSQVTATLTYQVSILYTSIANNQDFGHILQNGVKEYMWLNLTRFLELKFGCCCYETMFTFHIFKTHNNLNSCISLIHPLSILFHLFNPSEIWLLFQIFICVPTLTLTLLYDKYY